MPHPSIDTGSSQPSAPHGRRPSTRQPSAVGWLFGQTAETAEASSPLRAFAWPVLGGGGAGADSPSSASPRSTGPAPRSSSLRPSAVAANQLRADLLALCEAAVQSVRSRPFMTTDDIERTITSIVDDCFEMRGRIMDADEKPDERDAPASVTRSVAVEDAQPADAADPILGQVTAALSSGEGQGVLVSVFNELRRTIDPSGADVDPHTLGSVAKTATSFSEFIGMLQTSDISSSKDSKDVTRFLATNGLEIASTVVNVAKAAADFVPIPGLSAAVGMIDRIVKNVQDTRGSPRIVEDFCADLIDVKNIIAPMASQWFSADVRRKCNDLLALLKDAQRVTDQARAGSNSWAALLGNTTAKVEAQVESLRRQLARIKELLCLAIQVDSAMMLMRMAKQLNIIDIKADKMLSILRPRTLFLQHNDFMVAPKRLDSTGAFRVHEAKMDGATFVLKEFLESIKGNEKSIEAEARKWFNANHPNLMQLTGVCLSSDKETGMGPFFAMPFVEYDLESFMNTYPDLDTRDRLKILVRIARGIKYLHNLAPGAPIVHGSLSFRHIRIEADFEKTGRKTEMKLRKVVIVPSVGVVSALNRNEADALLMSPESRLKSAVGFKDGQFVYDFNWDDPENATKLLPKPPRDIYSFGILAGALLSRMTVAEFCESEKTPPQDIDGDLWEVLLNAANTATEHRPEIDKILEHLNQACKTQHELSFLRGTATDIEIICTIFPVWAQDGNITFSSNDPKGDLVYVYDPQTQRSTQTWRLEWNSRHALTSLQCDISGEISDEIGNLTHLRELWLDSNQFEGEIPRSIGRIRGLQSLRLNNNKLTGSVPVTLCQLTELRELDLSDNSITSLPSMISDLVNLRMLDLSDCLLTEIPEEVFMLENLEILLLNGKDNNGEPLGPLKVLPPSIGKLSKLRRLSLAYHVITAIPPEIGQLRRLTSLNMERNEIKELPDEIGNLRLLTKLYLEKNQIKKLPEAIGNLESLEILYLSDNQLTALPDTIGSLTHLDLLGLMNNQIETLPASLGNLSRLTYLDLDNNMIKKLPDEFCDLKRLKKIFLTSNQLEELPESFGNLAALKNLELPGNQLKTLPDSLSRLSRLRVLNLENNPLEELPDDFGNFPKMFLLKLGGTQLRALPDSIGKMTKLAVFHANFCNIEEVPASIEDMSSLEMIMLSGNPIKSFPEGFSKLSDINLIDLDSSQISTVPDWISQFTDLAYLSLGSLPLTSLPDSIGELSKLESLRLGSCKLETLPESIGNLGQLIHLYLNGNQLKELPQTLRKLKKLENIDISYNELQAFPDSIFSMPALRTIVASCCGISEIPDSFGSLDMLRELHLFDNKLTRLPNSITSLTTLETLRVSSNCLSELPDEIGSLSSLKSLDLDHNQLESIPESIGELSELNGLWLSHNKLTTLPKSIHRLSKLTGLHLSNNQLETLPRIFEGLESLATLYLSDNHLTYVHLQEHHLPKIVTIDISTNKFEEDPIPAAIRSRCSVYDAENPYVQNRPADEQDGGGAENDAGAQEAEGGDAEPQEGQDSQPESSGQPAGEEGGEDETAEEHKDADADE